METHIEIAKRLRKTSGLSFTTVDGLLDEVEKMLGVMIRNLNPNHKKS